MAQETGSGGAAAPTTKCASAADLLKDVSQQIADYEAKKLGELKTELEAFVKKQETLVKDYTTQYPELRRKWCTQNGEIDNLATQLKCTHDPTGEQWKELVTRCICQKQHEVDCLAEAVARRKRCCQGPLERAKEKAKARFDDAKAQLDVLQTLATKIDGAIGDHAKWITQIRNLTGPERAAVLYLFWFKLLPSHRRIMPRDLPGDCKVPGENETPEQICKDPWGKPCDPDPEACKPPDGEQPYANGGGPRGPWLIDPKDYPGALDCAWEEYRKAKNELALAEAAFKNAPDDLAAIIKQHGTRKDALEADTLACLKEWKRDDPCCKPPNGQPPKGEPKPPYGQQPPTGQPPYAPPPTGQPPYTPPGQPPTGQPPYAPPPGQPPTGQQPPYVPPPTGQPPYAPPPTGQPPYTPPPPGQPPTGQPPYAPPPTGQPPYAPPSGQPPYAPPTGQPPYGPPPEKPPSGQQPPYAPPPTGQPPYTPPPGQPPSGQPPYAPPTGQPPYGPPSEKPPSGQQPPYGPPPTGQPPYAPPPTGQPPYAPPTGQPPYGQQPPTGQPPSGQPPYGQPPSEQPPSGQPPYGQSQYGQPERGA